MKMNCILSEYRDTKLIASCCKYPRRRPTSEQVKPGHFGITVKPKDNYRIFSILIRTSFCRFLKRKKKEVSSRF